MKNNKGLTLVEVIVSLAILGLIAVAFLGAMSAHFTYLKSTVSITQNDFEAQELMEIAIDDAKIRVMDPGATLESVKIFNADLGGITVKYEEVAVSHDNKNYYTLVSNVRPDPLEIINLESIGIKLMQGVTQIQNDYYAYPNNDFSIIGNFENKTMYKWDHLLNQVEWYISTDKHNMPLPKGGQSINLNDEAHHYYPLFPRDYEILSNETIFKFGVSQSVFSDMSQLAGKFLIYAVTPAAKSGKLGNQLVSKPIFVSGLPVTNNLITHLDASYIDTLTNNSEAEMIGGNRLLKVWYDISSIKGRSMPNESAQSPASNSFRPFVNRSALEEKFIGQYVSFEPNRTIQINQGTSGNPVTIYTVTRNRSNETSMYLINGMNELFIDPSPLENPNQWNIIRTDLVLDGTNLNLGNSNIDIAEIAIYSGSLGTADDIKILDYLKNKYNTDNISNIIKN